MRISAWLVAALLMMFLPMPGAAQVDTALLTDASGDVNLVAEGNPLGDPAAAAASDLLSLSVKEESENMIFSVSVAALPSEGFFGAGTENFFQIGDTPYVVNTFIVGPTFAAIFGGGQNAFANLNLVEPDGDTSYISSLDIQLEGTTMLVTVPREILLDSNGAKPFPGMLIGGFHSYASVFEMGDGEANFGPLGSIPMPTATYSDRMPDTGNGTLPLDITLGAAQTGNARLFAQIPMRASNGEATTFVFEVDAKNIGEEADQFEIITVGAPGAWDVQLPINTIQLEAGANRTVPVLVSTPFSHQHGAAQTFMVEMHSINARDAVGRVEIGVRYNAIPQPAGHHNQVWFHSTAEELNEFETVFGTIFGFDGVRMVMNAAESYEGATSQPVRGSRDAKFNVEGTDPAFGGARWLIPLSPGLEMGLDFQTDKEGTATIPIDSVLPLTGARLEGALVHLAPGTSANNAMRGGGGLWFREGATKLASIPLTEKVDIGPASGHVFEVPIIPTERSDLIPFAEGAALVLELNLTYLKPETFFGPGDVPMMKGGSMQLPLNEYRDPVDDLFASIGNLVIHADSAQDRLVNPGMAAVYKFRVMDHGGAKGTYNVALTGPNSNWATLVEGDTVVLEEAGTAQVTVIVSVPETASDGDLADLVLQVTNRGDDTLRSIARLAAEVDTDANHEDETALALQLQGLAEAKKDTPGLALIGLIAALGVALLSRRR